MEKFDYPEPSDVVISTHTTVCSITDKLDLYLISRLISIYKSDDPVFETKEGHFYEITHYCEDNFTDMPRGIIDSKSNLSSQVFNNQITLRYKYWGFKTINVKLFTNGGLQMTGIKDPEFETQHLANQLIQHIQQLKFKIWFNKQKAKLNTTHQDIFIYYNAKTEKCEFMRYGLEFYSFENLLKYGIQYVFKGNDDETKEPQKNYWMTQHEVLKFINYNIQLIKPLITHFETLKNKITNQYSFSIDYREQLYNDCLKYKNIVKFTNKFGDLSDKDFKKYVLKKIIRDILKWLKSYIKFMNNLYVTDCHFLEIATKDDFMKKIKERHLKNTYSTVGQEDYIEFKTHYADHPFKYKNFKIEMINCDFNTKFNNNLEVISNLLTHKYNIYNSYKPNHKYAGVLVKFRYNDKYKDTTKYAPGVCHCEVNCIKKRKNKVECRCITICIFGPGSINLSGLQSNEEIEFIYTFINKFMKDNFEDVCQTNDLNFRKMLHLDNKYKHKKDKSCIIDYSNHEVNELKKIIKKPKLVYIPKNIIQY